MRRSCGYWETMLEVILERCILLHWSRLSISNCILAFPGPSMLKRPPCRDCRLNRGSPGISSGLTGMTSRPLHHQGNQTNSNTLRSSLTSTTPPICSKSRTILSSFARFLFFIRSDFTKINLSHPRGCQTSTRDDKPSHSRCIKRWAGKALRRQALHISRLSR
jgi:hypothetical protein